MRHLGRVGAQEERRACHLVAGDGDVERDVVAFEAPPPRIATVRLPEQRRVVLARIAGQAVGSPPTTAAELELAEHLLEPDDRGHLGVGRQGQDSGHHAERQLLLVGRHVRERHALAGRRPVRPITPLLLVLEREHEPGAPIVVDRVPEGDRRLPQTVDAFGHLNAFFRAAAASSMAGADAGTMASSPKNPCTIPSYRLERAETPACCRASA